MKKSLIALSIALSLSTSVFAGDYSDAVARQKYCSSKGEDARNIFVLKHTRTAAAMLSQMNSDGGLQDIDREINARTVNYAFNTATSEDDAYNGVWGMCMDLLSAGDEYRR